MSTIRRFVFLVLFPVVLVVAPGASAQTAPQIDYLFPAGAQRGTRVTVAVGGKYMPGPCGVWIDGDGVALQTPTTEGEIELAIDQDAATGPRAVRIHSVQGGSSPRQFVVGEFPEVIETENTEGGAVTLPVTINGQLDPQGDIDEFSVTLQHGQRIVCAAAVRSLGSPSDTMLRLLDARGRVVAYADDHRNLDPLLVYRCQAAGTFTLQMFDFNLAGGPEYVYRLTITDGPYLDYAFPAGVQRGVNSQVTLHGWNLSGGDTLPHTIEVGGDRAEIILPGCANRLALPVSEFTEIIETEPNDGLDEAQTVDASQVINGRFEVPGDVDVFQWPAKKGERRVIRVASAELGFPADVVLRIKDGDGKLVKEIDGVGPSSDPSFLFTPSADGNYFASLSERASRGGPRFIYRLEIRPPQPAVRLTVKTTEFAVVGGETQSVPVRVEPIDGFADEIEIFAIDLPSGVTAEAIRHTPTKAADVKLEFKAAEDARYVSGPLRIIARSISASNPGERLAIAQAATPAELPPSLTETLWLAVGPKVPFELATASAIQEAPRLAAFPFPVNIKRDEGFRDEVRLVGVEPDRRGTVAPLNGRIEAGQDSGAIPLIIQAQAVEGTTHRCRVMGVADVIGPDGKRYPVFHVAKGSMAMGCQPNLLTLRANPERIDCRAGQDIAVTLTVARRVAMQDVSVSLVASAETGGIQAGSIKLPPDRSQATMTIRLGAEFRTAQTLRLQLQAESSRNNLPIYATTELVLIVRQ